MWLPETRRASQAEQGCQHTHQAHTPHPHLQCIMDILSMLPSPWTWAGFLFGYNQQNGVGVTVWFLRLGCRKQAASASFLKYWLWNPELLCKQSNCSKAAMLWGSPTNPQGENTRKSLRPWEQGGKWGPSCSRHPRGSEWLQHCLQLQEELHDPAYPEFLAIETTGVTCCSAMITRTALQSLEVVFSYY